MAYLIAFQYTVIALFAGWTLAYHLVLVSALPAAATPLVWLCLSPPMLATVGWRSFRRLLHQRQRATVRPHGHGHPRAAEFGFALAVVLLGSAIGSALQFFGSFNPDDYNFFHRALTQLDHLDAGFFRHETGLTPNGLPQLSALHVMTSYEPLVALAAHAFDIDPLFAYQGGCTGIGALLMVVGFAVLYRTMGINRGLALLATVTAVGFMVLDLRPGRTYGSILPYLWTGKVLLWGVLLPWSIIFTVRFLRRPLPGRLAVLALIGVCAAGLSGSGVFLLPVQIFALSVAYLALQPPNRRRLRRAAVANTASAYCVGIAALGLSGILASPSDVSAWIEGWPREWWSNLGLVFSGPSVLVRDLIAIFLLPLIALRPPWGRFMLAFGIALLLLIANPLAGRLWMDAVTPGAYWRFVFLLPLAWAAGLVVVALLRPIAPGPPRTAALAVSGVYLISVLVAAWPTVTDATSNLRALSLKSPGASRLPTPEAKFARLASPRLAGRTLVCPERACIALALLDPSLRFEAVRGTPHVWANAGDPDEGTRRLAAQMAVTYGDPSALPALSASLDQGVDSLIVANAEPTRGAVLALLRGRDRERWKIAVEHPAYLLLLVE